MAMEDELNQEDESLENTAIVKEDKRGSLASYLSLNDNPLVNPSGSMKNLGKARPQTAAGRSEGISTGIGQLNRNNTAGPNDLRAEAQALKEAKGWKNTKKFDIDYKDLVRNASAIASLQFQSNNPLISKEDLISKRFNEEKLITNNIKKGDRGSEKNVVEASHYVKNIIRMAISEEEKEDNYIAFRDACEFLNLKEVHSDLSPRVKVIKSPSSSNKLNELNNKKNNPTPGGILKNNNNRASEKSLLKNLDKSNRPRTSKDKSIGKIHHVLNTTGSNNEKELSPKDNDSRNYLKRKDFQYVKENFEIIMNPAVILQHMRNINKYVFAQEKEFLKVTDEFKMLENEHWESLRKGN
jgi:hypothetical protein